MQGYRVGKRLFDLALAVPALLLLLAPMAAIAIWIRATSKGPAIYCQERVGKNGQTFLMYKLRTMRHDAESVTGPVWASDDDPRITRVGKVLRSLHLDELPQLWNVLQGEMDLIGPRPERPEFAAVLSKQIPGFGQRLSVRPGITSPASLAFRNEEQILIGLDWEKTYVESLMPRKLQIELEYMSQRSFWSNLGVLLETFGVVFRGGK